ncbi:Pkinase-domain-containing protein [Cutaneotrichosporon oleaginosum]|uniref:Pkinase-domain-containing protein n=1 Tax=Cutaneotrichosporon oleaginosum TaxID=879819 RepID=A0A0J0XKI4_9TREE|nr:Pkinase-domain-containing protein [Cutaneotrichosporon oleaginosum]KLT41616.1 Pkinase-domain-containing protein [Cutaneotrichosporon oleaginosum]TXT08145.1 hypothetical protein COLE_05069 [Cutaneotrichosporon oleaginosum]
MAPVPESQDGNYDDYFEPTQLSQPFRASQRNTQPENSQIEPRRKYWAVFIPINSDHSIIKLSWSKTLLKIGRHPASDVHLKEKRVSNNHCTISLGIKELKSARMGMGEDDLLHELRFREEAPDVWLEDSGSSNGTFVNGTRLTKGKRRLLQHGDEISLGHKESIDSHDVRYIFRSVGTRNTKREEGKVGEVYQRYQFLEQLGKGTFAEVKKAVDPETGDMRAIKLITKHRFNYDPKTLKLFEREISICTSLVHENVCRLVEWYEDPQHIALVLEYVDGGDLLSYIMNYKDSDMSPCPIPEEEATDLTFQICRAMAFCHEKGVTHRDLKPENILVTSKNESTERLIKIADFGLAKMITVEDKTMLKSLVGTPQYLAPEVVMQSTVSPGYENVCDSWSIGVIVYAMLTKNLPFDDNSELSIADRIKARATLEFDRTELERYNISSAGQDFIERLLEPDPTKRMTMDQALLHEWLSGPSSLPSEPSQSQALFGDSMWNIQEFGSEFGGTSDGGENMEMDADAVRSDWTRPATMSATNFGSAAMVASMVPTPGADMVVSVGEIKKASSVSSTESFSQPMENLRLTTAKVDELLQSRAEATESPPFRTNGTVEMRDATPTPGNIHGSSPKHAPMDLDSSAVTIGTKRKLPLSSNENPFSSGSLSPPPEAAKATATPKKKPSPPKKSGKKATPKRVSPSTAANRRTPAKAPGGARGDRDTTPRAEAVGHGRLTRATTARLTAQQQSPSSRTRSHVTKAAEARGTKSRRLE